MPSNVDQELSVLKSCYKALLKLEPSAQIRCARFLHHRFVFDQADHEGFSLGEEPIELVSPEPPKARTFAEEARDAFTEMPDEARSLVDEAEAALSIDSIADNPAFSKEATSSKS